ncbi:unnamed protein product (mitochondrion) [Plasmodiophora brassicae]|uniref:Uncharacterized protein n=1 Tax=Plasmodiophora brassicae TaxID=37360 RepID=A0A0G4J818_PLABS|nr:hypothetical protein PBRA_009517 [Plasmodiophora brassicae]SPQ99120.1 unnamed protein product [Plasmodiophora brassicae]
MQVFAGAGAWIRRLFRSRRSSRARSVSHRTPEKVVTAGDPAHTGVASRQQHADRAGLQRPTSPVAWLDQRGAFIELITRRASQHDLTRNDKLALACSYLQATDVAPDQRDIRESAPFVQGGEHCIASSGTSNGRAPYAQTMETGPTVTGNGALTDAFAVSRRGAGSCQPFGTIAAPTLLPAACT